MGTLVDDILSLFPSSSHYLLVFLGLCPHLGLSDRVFVEHSILLYLGCGVFRSSLNLFFFFFFLSFFTFHHDVRGGLGVLGHGAGLLCHC